MISREGIDRSRDERGTLFPLYRSDFLPSNIPNADLPNPKTTPHRPRAPKLPPPARRLIHLGEGETQPRNLPGNRPDAQQFRTRTLRRLRHGPGTAKWRNTFSSADIAIGIYACSLDYGGSETSCAGLEMVSVEILLPASSGMSSRRV